MAIPFTDKDDARGAYIAGSSGSPTYTSSGPITPAETQAFTAGVQSTQQNVPQIFQDTVEAAGPPTDEGILTLDRKKSIAQQQLDNLQNQDQAFEFLNTLNQLDTGGTSGMGILNPNVLGYIKDPLVSLGAFTTDPNEERNVYQLLLNKMFQGDQPQMSGAQPLNISDVLGLNRIGRTLFTDPNKTNFFGDLKGLFTGNNPAVIDILTDTVGGGIAELPEFGQAGLDFTKEQGFKDYGGGLDALVKAFTPAKYLDFILNPAKDALSMGKDLTSATLEKITEPVDALAKLIDSIGDDDE
tara:strand:+ start:1048 stop:1941 length:894 start_codon:yes stop_codon:yes gene_type:complete